jgi:prepilin-type N-terminal cleavage/methylation domain-containing protein
LERELNRTDIHHSAEFSHLKNHGGFGLVEMMIAVGVFGIVMMGILSLSTIILKSQTQTNFTFQADSARGAFEAPSGDALLRAASWAVRPPRSFDRGCRSLKLF